MRDLKNEARRRAMIYIWKPSKRSDARMHIQHHNALGQGYNAALCGIVYSGHYRTINAPFALGRKICKHCEAAAEGRRKLAA